MDGATAERPRRARIPTLDGWRAVSISFVLLSHSASGFDTSVYEALRLFGANGVLVFFAISGLLITKLLLEEADANGRIALRAFYVRRCFRILPVVLLYLAFLTISGLTRTPGELAASLFFYRNYLPFNLAGIYTFHFWSLAVEEQFYAFWPGLMRLTGNRFVWPTALTLSLGTAAWRWAAVALHLIDTKSVPPGSRTDFTLDSMLMGALTACILHRTESRLWLRRALHPAVWLCLAAATVALCVFTVPFGDFLKATTIPLLLAGTILNPDWPVSRLLEREPMCLLGRISYSVYIWQQMFLLPAWIPNRLGPLQLFPFSLLACLACASASYHWLEKPLIAIGRRLSDRYTKVSIHA